MLHALKLGFSTVTTGEPGSLEYHEKIWSLFQRLEARDKVVGTGISLSVVKKIVESRGERVSVESEIDAGATFRFKWPNYSQKRSSHDSLWWRSAR